jgi:hypothetical protein
MNSAKLLSILMLFLLSLASAITLSRESLASSPKCGERRVQYAPFDEDYSQRIILREAANSGPSEPEGNKAYSPQHTAWVSPRLPDYSRPGPWSTTVLIGSPVGSKVLQLAFQDHASGGVSIAWLNEKLLFGRVWWGRIYSTDFIIDVEKEQFIYKQMAEYGEMIQPCP